MVCVLGNIITYPEETCRLLGRVILTLPKCSVPKNITSKKTYFAGTLL